MPAAPQSYPSWPEHLAVLVPVYNHAPYIAGVVSELLAAGAQVWVVDDGSSDMSGSIAEDAGATLLTHACNQGKGAALLTGMHHLETCGFSHVLSVDADAQHPPEAWRRLVWPTTPHPEHTIVIGQREMSVAPLVSRFGFKVSNFWTIIACRNDPGDSQSGLRIYPLGLFLTLPVHGKRYHFEIEVLVRAAWAGYSFTPITVPVVYGTDRISHFHLCADNLRTTWAFTKLVTRRCLPFPIARLLPAPAKKSWKSIFTAHLNPVSAATASAIGAACGVAPLPGFQSLAAAYFAYRLRLNIPLTLLASNISCGPLLAFWAAVSVAIGQFLMTGSSFFDAYTLWEQRLLAVQNPSNMLDVLADAISYWAVGSLFLMPVVALVVGFSTFFLMHAHSYFRQHHTTPTEDDSHETP